MSIVPNKGSRAASKPKLPKYVQALWDAFRGTGLDTGLKEFLAGQIIMGVNHIAESEKKTASGAMDEADRMAWWQIDRLNLCCMMLRERERTAIEHLIETICTGEPALLVKSGVVRTRGLDSPLCDCVERLTLLGEDQLIALRAALIDLGQQRRHPDPADWWKHGQKES